ncbi:hypothetical protein K501DRAFT_285753 [Backusella circina FSU 941]|nr:hypothetical protein K501DRAFT_285753 [Backusella circina FSU 941]
MTYEKRYNRMDTQSCPPAFKNNYTSYALTEENISKVQFVDPSSTPLARFCSELECSTIYSSSTNSSQNQSRFTAADSVLESPRVLPFPYHNDSYFLPTAEHDYPGGSTNDTSSMANLSIGSRQTNLRSTGKCSMDSINRQALVGLRFEESSTKNRNNVNVNVVPRNHTPLRSRRNSFKSNGANNYDQKKYRLRLKPKNFFFNKKKTSLRNISYCSTTQASVLKTYNQEVGQVPVEKKTLSMVPWCKKALMFFKKSRNINKMSDSTKDVCPILFN